MWLGTELKTVLFKRKLNILRYGGVADGMLGLLVCEGKDFMGLKGFIKMLYR